MMVMSRRNRLVVAALFIVVAIAAASAVHYEGSVRPNGARVDVMIRESASWYAPPIVVARDDDRNGIYIVAPALPQGTEFAAIRIDTRTHEQTRTRVTLASQSPFRPFAPAGALRAQVRGVRFDRPAFHLLSFPDGGGPGVHRVDSATGRLDVMSGDRLLLTCNVFNSSNTAEVLSLISSDRGGRWLAALTRAPEGWRIFVFAILLEEL
jgi:hypothetical protein